MQRTSRLSSAEQVDQPAEAGLHPRADRDAGEDHHRQDHPEHQPVSKFLQEIVLVRSVIEIEPEMRADIGPDCSEAPFAPPRGNIAGEMPVAEHGQPHEQQAECERPGHQYVPIAGKREAVIAGNGHPVGEARNHQPCLLGGEAPIAPVKPAMRVRDRQSRHEQHRHAQQVQPMPDARTERVAFHASTPSRAR